MLGMQRISSIFVELIAGMLYIQFVDRGFHFREAEDLNGFSI